VNIIYRINEIINSIVWGPVAVAFLIGSGIYFTLFTKFFQFRNFGLILKKTIGSIFIKQKDPGANITPFQAVSTALAGTIGTGNIAGVATAITAGGPGAVFWMWVSGFFGMMTKYAEVALAVKFRNVGKNREYYGGPMYYIENGIGLRWLAVIFSFLCICASFGIGNISQSNSIAMALYSTFDIPPPLSGTAVAAICGFVLIGGVKRIAKAAEFIVPFMAFFYIAGSVIFLIYNFAHIPSAFLLIFEGAFHPQSVAGGVLGFTVKNAFHYGIARGVFTNEAGLGSAPIAHAVANCRHPAEQGLWGIFEVFFDTIVICTMTTLVILTADGGRLWQSGENGAVLTTKAFETVFGSYGSYFIAVAIIFFAVASILGWAFYGQRSIEYITGGNKKVLLVYRLVFIVLIVIGAISNIETAWSISDTLNGLMAIPNVLALLALSPFVFKITKDYMK